MAKKPSAKSQRRRHTPQRTCVVCRRTADKRALTRLVHVVDDGVYVDTTGKRSGRGAYLCDDPACWYKAQTTDALNSALRTTLTDADRERIRAASPRSDSSQE